MLDKQLTELVEIIILWGEKPQPPKQPGTSTKFPHVLAFSGPAPERLNGRLAMIWIVAA